MATAALPTHRLCLAARPQRYRAVKCSASSTTRPNVDVSRTSRRVFVGTGMAALALVSLPLASKAGNRTGEVKHTEKEWLEILGEDSYAVMRGAGTERPWSSPLNYEDRKGTFVCAGCGTPLFKSETKFSAGTGWPSFYDALPGTIDENPDYRGGMVRTECRCHRCKGHLGHVFNDGPPPTGLRYCMDGLSLRFQAA